MDDLDSVILNVSSPFSDFRYAKMKMINGFVGRKEELKKIYSAIRLVSENNSTLAIKVSGPGGSGKSTLFGYLIQLIRSKDIFKYIFSDESNRAHESDVLMLPCFIDAPKGEKASVRYFWSSLVNSLEGQFSETIKNFFEYFSMRFFFHCLRVIYEEFQDSEVLKIMNEFVLSFDQKIQKSDWDFVVNLDEIYNNKKIFKREYTERILQLLNKHARSLSQHRIIHKSNKEIRFTYKTDYIKALYDILNEDFELVESAMSQLSGLSSDFFKSDKNVIEFMLWVASTIEWINKKPVCFVVGIDNLGYLVEKSENHEETYTSFIQTLLQFRNDLQRFLFVLIGTTDDWERFEAFTRQNQDYKSQLSGFIYNVIELSRLKKEEAVEALRFRIQNFWIQHKKSPKDICYPFSESFFEYLYDYRLKNIREVLKTLNNLWEKFKSMGLVIKFSDPFELIRVVRSGQLDETDVVNFSPSDLLPFEIEAMRAAWNSISSGFADKERSKRVEKALANFLDILRENEEPRKICLVSHNPTIQFIQNGKTETRYPDVLVQIYNPLALEDKRTFEIQVKIHSENKKISLTEIKGSLETLQHRKTDALVFLYTGPGLDGNAQSYISETGLSYQVFGTDPPNENQFNAILFMVFYEEIMQKKPTVDLVHLTLRKIFGISLNDLIDLIRNIAPHQTIKQKSRDKLDSYIRKDLQPSSGLIRAGSEAESSSSGGISSAGNIASPIGSSQDGKGTGLASSNLLDSSDELTNVIKIYEGIHKIILLFCELAILRKDRFKGQVTKEYIKKNIPTDYSEEEARNIFDQLKQDAANKKEILFKYKGTSLVLTELGNRYYEYYAKQSK
jgi:hypothetical protein